MERFGKDGKIIFPLYLGKKHTNRTNQQKDRRVVTEAYCPNGCSIINEQYIIDDTPGLWLKFKSHDMEGQCVLSAVEGDRSKIILSGKLEPGIKTELCCPHCDTAFKNLVNCDCQPDANIIVIGLTPKLDYNNAISLCNVPGCDNHAFIPSSEALSKCY